MKNVWFHIGKIFAYIGKGAVAAALWTSQHPEVLQIVASAVPNSTAKAAIGKAATVIGAVEGK